MPADIAPVLLFDRGLTAVQHLNRHKIVVLTPCAKLRGQISFVDADAAASWDIASARVLVENVIRHVKFSGTVSSRIADADNGLWLRDARQTCARLLSLLRWTWHPRQVVFQPPMRLKCTSLWLVLELRFAFP